MNAKLPSPAAELTQAAIKEVVSAIPVVGGFVAELGACLVSPVEARKREWAEEIESAVKKLFEDHALLPEVLVKDPAFVSALIKATAVALATHRAEKRAMLRNLIVRIGARAIPDEELQHALLRLLEDLSAGHIEVLGSS